MEFLKDKILSHFLVKTETFLSNNPITAVIIVGVVYYLQHSGFSDEKLNNIISKKKKNK